MEMFSASYGPDDSSESSSSGSSTAQSGTQNGLQYGAHLRLRSKARAKKPSTVLFDARYEWRKGKYQTATYAVAQVAIRTGNIYFTGWYEKRLGSTGSFEPGDISNDPTHGVNWGEASAAAMPIAERLGGGIMVAFF
jgi:hypothetical protein